MPRLWIDTDNALGSRSGDVDDGFALAAVLMAHRRRSAALLGVSTVAGNTDAATAARCAEELLEVSGVEGSIPVHDGSLASAAAEAIASVPDRTAILAIGPLSNVAAATRIDPTLLERTTVWVVATVADRRRSPLLPLYCLNWRHDPAAARRVFDAPGAVRNLRVLPLDVVRRLRVGRGELERLAATGTFGSHLARHSQRWLRQSWWRYRSSCFPLWDLVAALGALGVLSEAVWSDRRLVDFDADAGWNWFLSSMTPVERSPDPESQ